MAVLLTGTTIGGNVALHAGNVSTYALPIGGGTLTGDLVIGTAASAALTQPFGDFAQLRFDNSHSNTNRGPNKIVMHNEGSAWIGGFGIHSDTVAYYSGGTHKWYKTTSQTASTQVMSLDASGNFTVAGTITAPLSGNATTATTLQTTRSINGTNFNGSANIETSYWGTARTITIGATGKSVNGNGNVSWSLGEIQAEYEVPLNTLRNNLGSPTVREAALFHGQFNNKFRFLAPTLQEESTDGTTWVTSTRASAAVLGDMMIGEGQASNIVAIPSGTVGTFGAYRLTWSVVGSTGYVFLNALYIWNSTNGNTINITIEAFHNTNGWVTITGPHATSNWPGHAYIPHSNIPYSNAASQYSQVRITFTSTHNSNTNQFNLYGIEWFGGYPQGRRNAEYYDRDKNVYFPASIQGSRLISTVASGTAPLSVTSSTVVGNLNADMVDGYHSSSLWKSDGGNWNPGANILLGQTANNQEWSFDITRNGYTGGYWHVWDSANSTMLKVDAVSGKVSAPYNFVGNLEGSATTLATARTLTIGATGKTFNGSANVSWTLAEIGAAASVHNHDDRYYTESESDTKYSLIGHEHDRTFLTDSRGAARLPSYYDDRYAQWDFQNSADTGAGGDTWHGLLTVAKWAVYDASHRQEQLAFTGNDLKRRTASSDSAWGGWKTILDSSNFSTWAQPAGSYLTAESDTLATVTARGNTTDGSINVHGNILLTGPVTTTNQGRIIDFTGFDKEGTTDFSDRAYIQHTINAGGHSGSVLVISSQNDAGDGIAFETNASSKLKHNSNNIATEPWVTAQGYLTSLPSHTHTPSEVGLGNVSNTAQVTTTNNTSLNTDSRNTRGVTRLYRRDDNSDFSVQTHWTGTHWFIRGYNGDTFHAEARVAYADTAGSATSATSATTAGSATTATTANRLERYGIIYGDNWNTYYQNNRLLAISAHNHTGSNRPTTAYTYGSGLSYYNAGSDHYQFFFPENGGSSNANNYKIHYRSGWNDSWGGWRTLVDVYNSVCAIDASVTATGDITAYSDARIKENINTLEGALDKTLSLRGVSYNRTDIEDKSTKIGFIAQELLEVVPEVVTEDEKGMYGVSYGNITALLVEAIKEQQKQIEELKLEIQKLKSI